MEGDRDRWRVRTSERASEFDVWAPKMTILFLWLETVLCILCTFSLINYHLSLIIMTSYDMILFQVSI